MVNGCLAYWNLFGKRKLPSLCKMYSGTSFVTGIGNLKKDAMKIFHDGVKSVQPNYLIMNSVKLSGTDSFTVKDVPYKLHKNIYVVGFGKAVGGMARSLEELLGARITSGILSLPSGTFKSMETSGALNLLPKAEGKIQVYEGAKDNLPDEHSFFATKQILGLISNLKEEDLTFVLISGGGSSLLTYPKPPVTLNEKSALIKALSSRGASIQEINCVRKRLSLVKGGGLAQAAYPSQVIAFILSDIIGDPLDLIASSPTVENEDSPEKALNILETYFSIDDVPDSVLGCLREAGLKNEQLQFNHVHNYLIGTNTKALQEAKRCAESLSYSAFILSSTLQGEASKVGKCFVWLSKTIVDISKNNEMPSIPQEIPLQFNISKENLEELITASAKVLATGKPLCLLSGGETTVTVKGSGKGGRNQEMCLSFGIESANVFHSRNNILFLSAGTDGIDGPTDAAGAVAHLQTASEAREENLDAETFLLNNDSYSFYKSFKSGRDHVLTGHTGTNVMDLQILLIHPEM